MVTTWKHFLIWFVEDTSTSKSVKDEPDQNGMEMRGMSSKNKSQGATADDEEEESDDEIYEAPVSDCND